jgi:CBS domain-containing protein
MARHFNDFDDDREPRNRPDRSTREQPWNYSRPYSGGRLENDYGQRDFGQGRFGERAGHETDEPRYNQYSDQYAREDYRRPSYEGRDRGLEYRNPATEYQPRSRYAEAGRSRLRVRDIMTRNLAVATRDTSLHDVAMMMKEEDTGVIPVVELRANGGNGGNGGNGRNETGEVRHNTSNYSHGKLLGLITDRDIVLRAVAEGKDCNATRAEEVMSTDAHTARPHERVVEVIRKMGDKQVRRIPVTNENGNLLGIVSMGDIAVETEADSELADALEEISRGSSFWGRLFS